MHFRRAGLALSMLLSVAATEPVQTPATILDAPLADIGPRQPGCAVGVMENGRLTHARGFGVADIETGGTITPQTPFNLASMSKSFTGAAIALLVRDGRIGLDDDIRRYLPELPAYGQPVRIRHLLHHTSGLRNHMALTAFQPGAPLPSHQEALALVFRQRALNFAPGSRHQYESPNYVLLAEIVSRVSGMSFEDFLTRRIFGPLGMAHTGFAVPGLARAYAPNPAGGFTLVERVNGARGSSNLVSTLEDFATWLGALDRGALGADLLPMMMAGTRLNDGTPISYGYGLAVERDHRGIAGLTMIGHGGQTAAYRSRFAYFPGRGFGTLMLCNVASAPLGTVDAAAAFWVDTHFDPIATPPIANRPLPAAEAARYAGFYLDAEGDAVQEIGLENGALTYVNFGTGYPLTAMGDGRFALGGGFELRFVDGAMTETGPGQPAIRYTRLPPPGTMRLADFAGRYRSAEVDGEIVIRVEGDALVVTAPFGEIRPAPVHPDGFAAQASDLAHLAFARDTAGQVTGFTISTTSGIARLRFDRAP